MITHDLPGFSEESLSYFSYQLLSIINCKPKKITDIIDEIRDSNNITSLITLRDILRSFCELIQKNLVNVNDLNNFIDFYKINKNIVSKKYYFMNTNSLSLLIQLSVKGAWVKSYKKLVDN